jgi:hypothetical protein
MKTVDGRPPREQDVMRLSHRDRMRDVLLKPINADARSTSGPMNKLRSVAELETNVKFANDKERLIGLIAAPFAAAIAILVSGSLIVNDPPARLKNGQINTLHVSVSLYHDLEIVLIALSLVMLATAIWRKRLYLGIATALYGLAIFNLHYWGFGVPFIMVSAWLLVRAYRLGRDLHESSRDDGSGAEGSKSSGSAAAQRSLPKPNRRYTQRHARRPSREVWRVGADRRAPRWPEATFLARKASCQAGRRCDVALRA